jgi:hypothetical protein
MQHPISTSTTNRPSALTRVALDPARMLSVADYWAEFDEPIELLDDPARTFAEDAARLGDICRANNIPHRPASGIHDGAFPVWMLREFYPVNP